jgi:hypothetical protein
LSAAFTFATIVCLLAAAASMLRGAQYRWGEQDSAAEDGRRSAEDAAAQPAVMASRAAHRALDGPPA